MTRLIRSLDDLVAAVCARRDELNISHELLDDLAGLQSGYVSKLLAPNRVKNFGAMSLPAVLGALGVALVLVEDTAATERMRGKWITAEAGAAESRLTHYWCVVRRALLVDGDVNNLENTYGGI